MWVKASLCPTVGSQLDNYPVQMGTKQPYLVEYSKNTVKLEEILIQIKTLTTTKLKIQATWQIKEHFGFFQGHLDSFQDPCLNLHKFNIFGFIWCISHQNKCQLLNFKFLNLLCPSGSIVAAYEQIWCIFKNTQKGW